MHRFFEFETMNKDRGVISVVPTDVMALEGNGASTFIWIRELGKFTCPGPLESYQQVLDFRLKGYLPPPDQPRPDDGCRLLTSGDVISFGDSDWTNDFTEGGYYAKGEGAWDSLSEKSDMIGVVWILGMRWHQRPIDT